MADRDQIQTQSQTQGQSQSQQPEVGSGKDRDRDRDREGDRARGGSRDDADNNSSQDEKREIVRQLFGDVGELKRDFSCAVESSILLHGE